MMLYQRVLSAHISIMMSPSLTDETTGVILVGHAFIIHFHWWC